MSVNARPKSRDGFQIAIICALPEERDTVENIMTAHFKDPKRPYGKAQGDDNVYTLGELGGKPVVLVAPRGMGKLNTRDLARGLRISFPNILYSFVVGITGGAPFTYEGKATAVSDKHLGDVGGAGGASFTYNGEAWKESDIHLGDVIISTHVVEYDFGKEHDHVFESWTDIETVLPRAPQEVANFIHQFERGRSAAFKRILGKTNADLAGHSELETGPGKYHEHPGSAGGVDHVYALGYRHKHQKSGTCETCDKCTKWQHEVCLFARDASCEDLGCEPCLTHRARDTKLHFGRYGSADAVLKSGHRRDLLIKQKHVIGFEMEGAGAWEVLPTIVIKGVQPTPNNSVEASSTAKRDWLLPRPANPQYTGYSYVLEYLKNRILAEDGELRNRRQLTIVMSGMGGVGKSETILQFVKRNRTPLHERLYAALWVDCGSEMTVRVDFRRISRLYDWNFGDDDILDGVKDRLVSSKTPILLILDNCDDSTVDYNRYIPNGD
ncbi:hypothetical protein LTR35_011502 [Friedmanniomyces endolithicus]|nr:hypothetical protein LTR35_011502 [Friedmanniomyces endolithicus]